MTPEEETRAMECALANCCGVVASALALEGLSFSYSCVKDTGQYDDFSHYGQGDFVAYYSGFKTPRNEHLRISFVPSDDEIKFSMVATWGAQGPGDHFHSPIITNPTEDQICNLIKEVAVYLRSVRGPVDI